ncbi:hypothetical protein OS493_018357 [Desmophyllum pertusum]|uniref:Platelet-derived growth factor (PDGF) family profile domain-containing protein n=1 Tax=Desmophyllum pertusum TaxID=174260 RepID=A0A9W9YC34_9CNID|nr:hypothetical protein OS493_018357 [Desmophyllum pertusum]
MISNVAAPSNGTWTTRWDTNKDAVPLYMFPDKSPYYCGPFPTMVQFDKPSDVIFIPPTVRLLRCVGGCDSTHNFRNCTVVSQEEVVLTVWELGKYSGPKNITVYNHTKCACSCIKRKSDCDEKIRVYNERKCDCDCKYDKSSCNLATHDWSTTECECKCKAAPKHCDGKGGYTKNHEWNPDICDCDCKQRVKDRCARKGKVLNKSKCECECKKPLPVCVAGTKFQKSSCTCAKDTSVITK